jgi:hypothetical protein
MPANNLAFIIKKPIWLFNCLRKTLSFY